MQTLYVRDVMTSPVIAVTARTPLPQINHLMREQHVRRVPVVEGDRLVGLITLGDVRNALPSEATSLSVYELTYLLDRVTAASVMRTNVITIAAGASVIEAAQLMLEHKISGLPVVEGRSIVGMITESDIFRVLVGGTLELVPTLPAVAVNASPLPRSII
jgi:CBS domain-containing protein